MSKLRTLGDLLTFWCPGCQCEHAISVNSGVPGRDWTFNGDPIRPTFSPSVLWQSTMCLHDGEELERDLEQWRKDRTPIPHVDRRCHSYVTAGRIAFLGDCNHALAGQTVDLPDHPHRNTTDD